MPSVLQGSCQGMYFSSKNARLHKFCPHTPSIKSYMGEPGHLLKGAALGHGIDILGQSLFLQPLFRPCIMHSVFIHIYARMYRINWQAILTRVNSFTQVEYRNDATIFGWELMNEPECSSDPSGNTLQVQFGS